MLNIASPSELVKTVGFAHTAATVEKTPIAISGQLFIPINTKDADEHNAFAYETEVDNVPATAAEVWVPGQALYWDPGTSMLTNVAGALTIFGHALQPKAATVAVSPLVAFNSFASA
ncbi:MAG: DUF2190 family protein [Lysobacter sp.]